MYETSFKGLQRRIIAQSIKTKPSFLSKSRGGIISYQTQIKRVSGRKVGDIFIFALSTCIWCRKTKQLFKDLGVEYSYVDVDLLQGKDQDEAMKEMGKWNKTQSFPMIVLDNKKSMLGFKEQDIRDYCETKK